MIKAGTPIENTPVQAQEGTWSMMRHPERLRDWSCHRGRGLIAAALLIWATCNSGGTNNAMSASGGSDATHDGGSSGLGGVGGAGAAGTDESNFACLGHPATTGTGGNGFGGVGGSTGGSGGGGTGGAPISDTCVVGQTYCFVDISPPQIPSGGSTGQCRNVDANCVANPTCACIWPVTLVGCSCAGTGGLVTVTCQGI